MRLREMFSPLGGPKDDNNDIDWIGDLKYYIDNNDDLLQNYLFPAVKKHQAHIGDPKVYRVYLNPLMKCREKYVKEYEVEDADSKISKDLIIELAKRIADEQESHIKKKDYKVKEDAAGVGIITKQNTTKDVNKGTLRKMMKGYRLVDSQSEEVAEGGYGKYWCSTDKKWKYRKGPKQKRA